MGTYINIGNAGFQRARNSEYVDKSGLIAVVNSTLFTERCFSCVTRCRRFGKSMAAKMLYAYYDHSCDSRSLFTDLNIAHDPSFEKHLNKYAAIYLDMTDFVSKEKSDDIVEKIDAALLADVSKAYPDVPVEDDDCLLPTGKGFADLVLIPRKHVSSPAIILELKYDKDADTAIDQILRKQYPAKVAEYTGELLLVGINYDKQQKTHQCRIVKIDK